MTRYLFIIILVIAFNVSKAQSLGTYVDKLYFGMLSFKPDTTISKFIAKYVPVVLKKWDTSAKWTAYPSDYQLKEPQFITVTSSFIFYKHPYFNAPFKSGQLAITQKVYEIETLNASITNLTLLFEFDDEKAARQAFKQLVDTFSSFKVLKRISVDKGMDKAEFTDKALDKFYSNIQIIMVEDYLLGKKYALPTDKGFKIRTEAGYKILVEIGNELYY